MALQVVLLLLAVALLDSTNGYPIDQVDACLFSCDSCFKGEVLLTCANECLLTDGNEMPLVWTTICPYFETFYFTTR